MTPHEMLAAPFAYMPPSRILDGLPASSAAVRVDNAPHSIAEVVAHLVFWQTWFLDRVVGRPVPMVASAAEGWPPAGEADWGRLRDDFLGGLHRAIDLAAMDGAASRRLEPAIEFPPLAEYTVSDALTHVAMHNAHHLGQIVTLRQLLGAWPPPDGSWTW